MPPGITNEPSWVKNCCKIRARARDLLERRLDLFAAAIEIDRLAHWTRLEEDADIQIFRKILGQSLRLPIGPEREYWQPHALLREDEKIQIIRAQWIGPAILAAKSIERRFVWAITRRAELAGLGVRGPQVSRKGRAD
jgi:hypothetical protein